MILGKFVVLLAALFLCLLPARICCAGDPWASIDAAAIRLAYSDSAHRNVGHLFECEAGAQEDFIPQRSHGSVTYWREGICFTAAHCFYGTDKKYKVYFELDDGRIDFYNVERFIIHDNYYSYTYHDLAMLKLREPVTGLQELSIADDFDPYDRTLPDKSKELIYVGYGKPYDGLDYINTLNDGHLRACRSRVFQNPGFVLLKIAPHRLMSQPYRARVFGVFDEKLQFKGRHEPRDLFEDELFAQPGMSGGMAYHKEFGLIGINVMVHDLLQSPIHKWMLKTAPYIDFLWGMRGLRRMFRDIPHLRIPPDFYTGRVTLTIRLNKFKDWIAESKEKLLSGDGVDLEQGLRGAPRESNQPKDNPAIWRNIFYGIQCGDVVTICVVAGCAGYIFLHMVYSMF